MIEAVLAKGSVLKRIMDAMKDLVTDANFDCSSTGKEEQRVWLCHMAKFKFAVTVQAFLFKRWTPVTFRLCICFFARKAFNTSVLTAMWHSASTW